MRPVGYYIAAAVLKMKLSEREEDIEGTGTGSGMGGGGVHGDRGKGTEG